jgi:hypothetical protein
MEVPVHDARGVDGAQALRQPGRQRHQGTVRQRPALRDRLGQRPADDISRRQPRHVAVQIGVEHGGDEGSAYCPRGVHLRPELGPEPWIGGQLGPDDLHRGRDPGRRAAQEHLSQAAAAQLPEQAVWADRTRLVRRKRRYHLIPTRRPRGSALAT